MNIALIHDHLNQMGGAEKVLKAFTAMYPQAPIFTILFAKKIQTQHFSDTKVIGSYLQKKYFAHRFFIV